MSESDSYDIIVDVDGWPNTPAALADLVARVVDAPVVRVRAILDVPGAPVATVAGRSEADALADVLAAQGVAATVHPRGARRSLGELTGRASSSPAWTSSDESPGVPTGRSSGSTPPPAGAPGGATLTPGWTARDDSKPSVPEPPGATVVGMPARGDDLSTTVVQAGGTETADFPAAPEPAAVAPPKGADRSPSSSGKTGWAGILGDALAERLVGGEEADEEDALGSHGGPPAESAAPPPELAAAVRLSTDSTDPTAAAPDPASSATFVAPASGVTLDPHMAEVSARAAIAVAGAAVPALSADAGERHAEVVESPRGALPVPEGAGASPGAWAQAGVSVDGLEEVAVPAVPVGVPAPPLGVRSSEPDADLARGDTMVLEPSASDVAPSGPSAGAPLSVGDRFVRLRPPTGDSAAAPAEPDSDFQLPDPMRAAAWGAIAPGAGFAYLGEPSRGMTYALSAFLIVPWISGAVVAARDAAAIRDGTRLPSRRTGASTAVRFAAAFWLAVAVLAGGFFGIRGAARGGRTEVTAPGREPGVTGTDGVVVDSGSASGFTGPPSEEEIPTAASGAESADDGTEARQRLEQLLWDARMACEAGRFFQCRQYAEEALEIDERNREATLLHVRAVTEGVVTPPPDMPLESGNDRQPDRSPSPR